MGQGGGATSQPLRGEVWFGHFDPSIGREQGGERPCLIVSDDPFNRGPAELFIVLLITTTDRRLRAHVPVVTPEGGLRRPSFVMCEQMRTVAKERLTVFWGSVSSRTMAEVEDRLRVLLQL